MTSSPHPCTITSGVYPFRVRYAEVDRQNAVHHSRYAVYFEAARTELLRDNGYDYADLEAAGIFLVVAKMDFRFKAPARYDDRITCHVSITRADRVRIEHAYRLVRDSDHALLVTANTTLVCIDASGKLQEIPAFLRQQNP